MSTQFVKLKTADEMVKIIEKHTGISCRDIEGEFDNINFSNGALMRIQDDLTKDFRAQIRLLYEMLEDKD